MNPQKLKICICGGGALGTVCAAVFSSNGHDVNLLTGKPQKWSKNISVLDPDGKIFHGNLQKISDDPQETIKGVDIILLCVPGYLIENQLNAIKPFLQKNSIVGSIVATTGFFFAAHDILSNNNPLFGFQRVPYIARIKEYGRSAYLLGYKDSLNLAIENYNKPILLANLLSNLFNTPINLLNNYLEASLTNSNPLLHTSRLYSLWNGKEFQGVDKPILFYSEWTNKTSELLLNMDQEFMELINVLNLSQENIKSLLEHYEVWDAKSLTNKIKNIPAFKNILAPMKKIGDKWYPDFNSRYFTEDFPFGLKFIYKLGEENKINCNYIKKVFNWGISVLINN